MKDIMNKDSNKNLLLGEIILEGAVLSGYIIGILPTAYYMTFMYTIPALIGILIISNLNEGGKKDSNAEIITNLIMSVLAFIPILGWIALIIGCIISGSRIADLSRIYKNLKKSEREKPSSSKTTKVVDVESAEG